MTFARRLTQGTGMALVVVGVGGGAFTEASIAWHAVTESSFSQQADYMLGYGLLAVVLGGVGFCVYRAGSAQDATARRARRVLGTGLCLLSLPLVGLSVLSAVLSGLSGFADPESVRPAGFWLCTGLVLLWVGRRVLRQAQVRADDDW